MITLYTCGNCVSYDQIIRNLNQIINYIAYCMIILYLTFLFV